MKQRLFSISALLTLLVLSPAASAQSPYPNLSLSETDAATVTANKSGAYIVLMADDPAVAYDGGIDGLKATKPARGQKLNPNKRAVVKYRDHLRATHDAALAAAGIDGANKFYSYTVAFNGFAATMTDAQAAALRAQDNVLYVWNDELRTPTTDRSDDYLDMPSMWSAAGGEDFAGEGIIIGVIDTGIDPDNPSFSDQDGNANRPGNSNKRNFTYDPVPSNFYGICQSGELWSQDDCNRKVIGARYFKDGFTNFEINLSGDHLSARDADGHGSHTASTAGGNRAEVTLPNGETDTIVGMAPRARLSIYKTCWADAGCATSDLVSAIDTAVTDGVDVINYSIGSSASSFTSPDDISFLFAANAGVFVATSNGNSGPGANTTGSPSSAPWLLSVGALQHGRNFLGTAGTGDGSTYSGASLNDTEVTGTLVDSVDAGDELCNPGALNPAVVTGNIVLCRRGAIARVDKSLAVSQAGGIGMIMYNPSPDSLNADDHSVPSLHVDHVAGPGIKAYIAGAGTGGATATIYEGGILATVGDGVMAGFSSRGHGASDDIIKPDIAAPGVNILAAAPSQTFFGPTNGSDFLSGTSMSSPHIAGIAAMVKQAQPDWSPAMIKSALMTNADPSTVRKEDQVTPATPFDTGSGLVQPGASLEPGLVYDAGFLDYIAFLCGNSNIVGSGTCAVLDSLGYPFDGSDLNQPNIAIGALAGNQMVTREVTNVGPGATYSVSVDAPAGVDVTVLPATLTLAAGESDSYTVEFETQTGATIGDWHFGSLTWADGVHSARSAIAVRPVQAAVAAEVSGSGTSGSVDFDITFGYDGAYTALPHGLDPAAMQAGNVVDDPANDINTALSSGVGITIHPVVVPSGTGLSRFSLFDDYTDGNDDLDLYIFGPGPGYPFVGGSGSGTSEEEVTVASPAPGMYLAVVHGWQTDGPDANYSLFSWSVPSASGSSNMSVIAPAAATLGVMDTIGVSWTGLTPGTKYLGGVSHSDTGGPFDFTVIRVDTD